MIVEPHTRIRKTKVLNFRLHPSFELNLRDIFKESGNYLSVLSRYCSNDLHKQKAQRWNDSDKVWAEQLKNQQEQLILLGAGPEYRNFECFSLRKNGIVIHFRPYSVGSHAEGNYEVFIPAYEIKSVLQEEIVDILRWTHM